MVTATASFLERQPVLGALWGLSLKESELWIEDGGAQDLAVLARSIQTGRPPEERGAKATEGCSSSPEAAILSRRRGYHGCKSRFLGSGLTAPQRQS